MLIKHNGAMMLGTTTMHILQGLFTDALLRAGQAAQPLPTCIRPGCENPTWNKQPGERCSRRCRDAAQFAAADAAQAAQPLPTCIRPGCENPTWNRQPGEHCSRRCRDAAQFAAADAAQAAQPLPTCIRPGCENPTWNRQPGEHCSRRCRDAAQFAAADAAQAAQPLPTCIRPGCENPTWNKQPGEHCSRRCRDAAQFAAADAAQAAQPLPTCIRPGCENPTWNKQPGEHCSRRCRGAAQFAAADVAQAREDCDESLKKCGSWLSKLLATWCDWLGGCCGPRKASRSEANPILFCAGPIGDGILAFYFPGYSTPVDDICQAGFLGNFYSRSLLVQSCGSPFAQFENAEAAFQSLKYWGHKEQFQTLSGEEAFQLSRSLRRSTPMDASYGGYGSNWMAMQHVLRQKFQDEELREMLVATGSLFLLEHNPVRGRDAIWSNNNDGSGTNWLGMQLMLLRDELQGQALWTGWLQQHVNLSTGEPLGSAWPQLVHSATKATLSWTEMS
ncbi:unnamed protein product [Effrenium voratum]|nr:unnamed protein product [Effrenium voratum]